MISAGSWSNGHTDTAGPADYNMELSQERANTVAEALVQAGIPAQIVTTEAWGFTDLAVQTPPETPLQANRRVVMDFSAKRSSAYDVSPVAGRPPGAAPATGFVSASGLRRRAGGGR